jgi:hypothetical protein
VYNSCFALLSAAIAGAVACAVSPHNYKLTHMQQYAALLGDHSSRTFTHNNTNTHCKFLQSRHNLEAAGRCLSRVSAKVTEMKQTDRRRLNEEYQRLVNGLAEGQGGGGIGPIPGG